MNQKTKNNNLIENKTNLNNEIKELKLKINELEKKIPDNNIIEELNEIINEKNIENSNLIS